MAKIDLEKKRTGGMGWLWALLLLVALALLLWWLWGAWDSEPDYAVDEVLEEPYEEPVATAPETGMEESAAVAAAGIPVSQILADPDAWAGRTVSGQVSVPEVSTDRGFWVEENGQRLLALIIDRPAEVPLHIQEGQTLELTDATIRRAGGELGEVEGRPLDADTRRMAEEEPVVLVVDESDIRIL